MLMIDSPPQDAPIIVNGMQLCRTLQVLGGGASTPDWIREHQYHCSFVRANSISLFQLVQLLVNALLPARSNENAFLVKGRGVSAGAI